MDNDLFKPKILIVDDIPENLFVLEKILSKLDAHVIRATSGNEALTQILDHDFALIILDVQMPEMDGYEVAEILKSNENTENVPIIFVTAIDRDDAKEIKGYGTGAVDFIFKPLNKFILLSKVKVFLEMHKIKNSLEQVVSERTFALRQANAELKEQIKKNLEVTSEVELARAYLLKVINSITSCLISVDQSGIITDMNSHASSLAKIESKNAKGKPVIEVFPFYNLLGLNIQRAMDSGQIIEKNRIPVYIRGKLVINNFAIYPFNFNDNHGAVIRIDDVTERVKMDEIVIQSEKMLSMGGIAAGMAHEINNPLAGIIQNIQVIRNRIHGDLPANHTAAKECGITVEALRQYIEKRDVLRMVESVHQSGNRAAQIVDDMLAFSRKQQGALKDEKLAELIERSLKLALADYRTKSDADLSNLEIIRNYQEDMPLVSCQSGKIQQVLLNILKNALQAMEHNEATEDRAVFDNGKYGTGTEKDKGIKKDGYIQKQISISTYLQDDNMATIEITDNGEGMSEETSKKIFEPFFSTKKSGTGLGLSISYFIITEDHKGSLNVFSTPGIGTTFTIKLPLKKSKSTL